MLMACLLVVLVSGVGFGLLLLWSAVADRYDRLAAGKMFDDDEPGDYL